VDDILSWPIVRGSRDVEHVVPWSVGDRDERRAPMIVDARTLDDDVIDTDVCIIGAGPAGIAMAREFDGSDVRVCVLESGGLDSDEGTASLQRGESVGVPYDRLDDARTRIFGGNSRAWSIDLGDEDISGARLQALDSIDFEQRDWIPFSGWPFDRLHLDPYYQRAREFFRVGEARDDVDKWFSPDAYQPPAVRTARMDTTVFQFTRGSHFRDEYRNLLHLSANVEVLLYANVVELEAGESGRDVEAVRVACLPGPDYVLMASGTGFNRVRVAPLEPRRFRVKARRFVLASGGTENARLLLLSRGRHPAGLGNQHDLVGRFFMEHPHVWSATFVPSDKRFEAPASMYRIGRVSDVPVMAKWTLTERVRRKERLLGFCASILPKHKRPLPDGADSLVMLLRGARSRRLPRRFGRHLYRVARFSPGIVRYAYERKFGRSEADPSAAAAPVFRLDNMAEQAPNPDSRVMLADERDVLGLPRVRLDWRLGRSDLDSMVRAQEIFDRELRRTGVGRLLIDHDREMLLRRVKGGWHHMGTTRMHVDPRQGVVDERGRVHGITNLYIAGSSVFPTCGYANPLLTVGALAIRLADQLKSDLVDVVRIGAPA